MQFKPEEVPEPVHFRGAVNKGDHRCHGKVPSGKRNWRRSCMQPKGVCNVAFRMKARIVEAQERRGHVHCQATAKQEHSLIKRTRTQQQTNCQWGCFLLDQEQYRTLILVKDKAPFYNT